MLLKIKKLHDKAILPTRGSKHAAGLDLYADVERIIDAGRSESIGTGICVAIPPGYEGQIRSRSGMAFRYDVTAFAGTIDADFRGEIQVLLHNNGALPYHVVVGQRIAQLVVAPIALLEIGAVDSLDETMRGAGGFGSTGR